MSRSPPVNIGMLMCSLRRSGKDMEYKNLIQGVIHRL
jgi:hypothetical protein